MRLGNHENECWWVCGDLLHVHVLFPYIGSFNLMHSELCSPCHFWLIVTSVTSSKCCIVGKCHVHQDQVNMSYHEYQTCYNEHTSISIFQLDDVSESFRACIVAPRALEGVQPLDLQRLLRLRFFSSGNSLDFSAADSLQVLSHCSSGWFTMDDLPQNQFTVTVIFSTEPEHHEPVLNDVIQMFDNFDGMDCDLNDYVFPMLTPMNQMLSPPVEAMTTLWAAWDEPLAEEDPAGNLTCAALLRSSSFWASPVCHPISLKHSAFSRGVFACSRYTLTGIFQHHNLASNSFMMMFQCIHEIVNGTILWNVEWRTSLQMSDNLWNHGSTCCIYSKAQVSSGVLNANFGAGCAFCTSSLTWGPGLLHLSSDSETTYQSFNLETRQVMWSQLEVSLQRTLQVESAPSLGLG